eukprot:CAMPEP_0194304004 /NCGR_PEP_ID=MMETSP0171-20130528/1806_1 /TAXON_ID=218684 /ORGANISM="Corethron pennatum, Strain L29A3" /LENGTH=55 /DNA_ID=CAMNT_0039055105 /DNA_START=231 /DNA_END=398 /DNA_ORIENTATION=-
MVAHVAGLTPGDFEHVIGDAHAYVDHLGELEEQMTRMPQPFPKHADAPALSEASV